MPVGVHERPIFSAKFTLILAVLFVLPLSVQTLIGVEPWPAMLLPGGGSRIEVKDGCAKFSVLRVTVESDGVEAQRLDPVRLLEPIPVQYINGLSKRNFGQERGETRFRLRYFGNEWTVARTPPTPEAARDARYWLAKRVREMGYSGDLLVFRWSMITVDLQSGDELDRNDESETVVSLL